MRGNRLNWVAYRVAPNPDGSTTWMPDAYRAADPRGAAEHIPSIGVASAGHSTILEVGDDDSMMVTLRARPPRRFVAPWRWRGVGPALGPSADGEE